MSNTEKYLTIPAAQRLGTDVVYIENEVDFSKEAVANGNSLDVLKLPKGAVLKRAGWITKTTEASVTFNVEGSSQTLVGGSATGIGADNAVVDNPVTATEVVTGSDERLRVTVGGADATSAVVVFFSEYIVSDACRN